MQFSNLRKASQLLTNKIKRKGTLLIDTVVTAGSDYANYMPHQ